MGKSQVGRAGELALQLYALVTSSGAIDIYAYRIEEGGRVVLEFRARPSGDDTFAAFRIEPLQLGTAIVTSIEESPSPLQWLAALVAGP